mmetsp:Transcript_27456/g.31744  ORF Transcript_27456/g.31744 Transcript_27456/m.31744 type:complete len:92 (-) Transcript_27456:30-305(-)
MPHRYDRIPRRLLQHHCPLRFLAAVTLMVLMMEAVVVDPLRYLRVYDDARAVDGVDVDVGVDGDDAMTSLDACFICVYLQWWVMGMGCGDG